VLEPDDRHPLLDALRPPAGFVLDRAVGTTFSLDLHALLTAPVAFALLDAESSDDGLSAPTAILEAVRRQADLIDVFCQAGQIAVPTAYRPLVAYVEQIVHEVSVPKKGRVFHPKVWAIRFRSPSGERCYRVLCLSRNLTFDRSWDTVLRLDGVPARRSRALMAKNRPLSRFVDALPGLARRMDTKRAEAVHELAEELLAVDFELPNGVSDLRFWPLGIRGLPSWPFDEDGWAHSRLLVVSPFLSPGLLARLRAPGASNVLVSRAETIDSLEPSALADFEEVLAMNADAAGAEDGAASLSAEDEELAERPEYPLSGLHAKAFVSEYDRSARLWTGSANATNAAFSGNVEFLVELKGPRRGCGVDAVLEGQSGGVKFRDLLVSHVPSGVTAADTAQARLERRLDEVRRAVAACGFEAIVASQEAEDESYSLLFRGAERDLVGSLRGVRARVWPITIDSEGAKPLASAFTKGVRFAPVSFAALTAFFAIELTARSRDAHATVRFVVNADLQGAPANRHDRLLTSILRNRDDVLRYLLLLLADERLASAIAGAGASDHGSGDGPGILGQLPVLESMVRALSRDPERLDHVERLLASLGASEEGKALIPDGLESVWAPILAARRKLRT
jgi:hypothetical protein